MSNNQQTNEKEEQSKPLIQNKNQQEERKIKTIKIFSYEIDLPLICLCVLNFFFNAACSVIAPFFPPLALGTQSIFPGDPLRISAGWVGLIIGIYPIGGFFFGLFVAQFMARLGRRKLMFWSLVVNVITLIAMGLCWNLRDNVNGFLAVSLISRFFMGMARSGYGSTCFAYAPYLWPTKVPRMISIMETCTGLGLMLGPIIGSGFFALFDDPGLKYQMVFYLLTAIFVIFAPSVFLLEADKPFELKKKEIKLLQILSNINILLLFLVLSAASFALTYVYPLFTDHVNLLFGTPLTLGSIYMTVGTVTYIISLLSMPILMRYKFLISIGLFMGVIATQLMAPGRWIYIPQEEWLVIVGLLLSGASQGFCILPWIPDGLFMASYSLGTFIGPTIGGFINQAFEDSQAAVTFCEKLNYQPKNYHICENYYSFMWTSYVMSISALFIFILYMAFGQGWKGWKRQPKKKLATSVTKEMVDSKLQKQVKDYQDMKQQKQKSKIHHDVIDQSLKGELTDALISDSDQSVSQFQFKKVSKDYEYEKTDDEDLEKDKSDMIIAEVQNNQEIQNEILSKASSIRGSFA